MVRNSLTWVLQSTTPLLDLHIYLEAEKSITVAAVESTGQFDGTHQTPISRMIASTEANLAQKLVDQMPAPPPQTVANWFVSCAVTEVTSLQSALINLCRVLERRTWPAVLYAQAIVDGCTAIRQARRLAALPIMALFIDALLRMIGPLGSMVMEILVPYVAQSCEPHLARQLLRSPYRIKFKRPLLNIAAACKDIFSELKGTVAGAQFLCDITSTTRTEGMMSVAPKQIWLENNAAAIFVAMLLSTAQQNLAAAPIPELLLFAIAAQTPYAADAMAIFPRTNFEIVCSKDSCCLHSLMNAALFGTPTFQTIVAKILVELARAPGMFTHAHEGCPQSLRPSDKTPVVVYALLPQYRLEPAVTHILRTIATTATPLQIRWNCPGINTVLCHHATRGGGGKLANITYTLSGPLAHQIVRSACAHTSTRTHVWAWCMLHLNSLFETTFNYTAQWRADKDGEMAMMLTTLRSAYDQTAFDNTRSIFDTIADSRVPNTTVAAYLDQPVDTVEAFRKATVQYARATLATAAVPRDTRRRLFRTLFFTPQIDRRFCKGLRLGITTSTPHWLLSPSKRRVFFTLIMSTQITRKSNLPLPLDMALAIATFLPVDSSQ